MSLDGYEVVKPKVGVRMYCVEIALLAASRRIEATSISSHATTRVCGRHLINVPPLQLG
jgi:hypothetical protein